MSDEIDNVVEFKPKNPRNHYSLFDIIDSPIAIYAMTWTIKNVLMRNSSDAVAGVDINEHHKEYYYLNDDDKDRYSILLTRHIQDIMRNSLKELIEYPDASIDNLVLQTLKRHRGDA